MVGYRVNGMHQSNQPLKTIQIHKFKFGAPFPIPEVARAKRKHSDELGTNKVQRAVKRSQFHSHPSYHGTTGFWTDVRDSRYSIAAISTTFVYSTTLNKASFPIDTECMNPSPSKNI
ncbi:hypothetical protein D5086_026026 [Populus alba]|uniref:Uncharacterized protein n=1 Tax=Populus alba TaxID=43335 RepID=A0ACC4B2B2_POPAL